jgi:CHAD domain-containing protein
MGYLIYEAESLADGIRRIAREQVEQALEGLSRLKERDKGIYEARKCSKRLRAIVRFVRLSVGEATYQRENAVLRNFADALAPARDSFIIIQTLDKVLASLPSHPTYVALRATWLKEAKHLRNATLDNTALMHNLRTQLQAFVVRMDDWNLQPGEDFSLLAPNLYTTYARGQALAQHLSPQADVHLFHDWRKRVKHLWYQTTLLQAFGRMDERIAQLDSLGDLLGTAHDYIVFEERLAALEASPELDALRQTAQQQRYALEQQALEQGAPFYRQRTLDFITEVAYPYYLSKRLTP